MEEYDRQLLGMRNHRHGLERQREAMNRRIEVIDEKIKRLDSTVDDVIESVTDEVVKEELRKEVEVWKSQLMDESSSASES